MARYGILLALVVLASNQGAGAQTDPCDTNLDGVVDAFEASLCGAPPPPGDPCDTNLDGVVDAFEASLWGAPPPPAGAPCDTNGDGTVDATEAELCGAGSSDQKVKDWFLSPEASDVNGNG